MNAQPILIQNELRMGRPLQSLIDRFALQVHRHTQRNNLVHFKYTIESPLREPLVQQCRGLILDDANNWGTVARPFDKFFNFGDPLAAKISWQHARIYTKLDGSLLYLYHYDNAWHVATTGRADASGIVAGWDMSFKDLFWRAFIDHKYESPKDQSLTYMFELQSPYNQVVVRQTKLTLTLLAARRKDGTYIAADRFMNDFKVVEQRPWQPLPQLAKFEGINGMEMEGYVIRDADFNMVKLKHPDYVIAHQLKGSFSPRMVIEAVRSGDFGEMVATFPEWATEFNLIKSLYDKLHNRIMGVWLATRETERKKDFALKVKALPFSGILFGLYDKHYTTVGDGLRSMHVDRLQELLEKVAKE